MKSVTDTLTAIGTGFTVGGATDIAISTVEVANHQSAVTTIIIGVITLLFQIVGLFKKNKNGSN